MSNITDLKLANLADLGYTGTVNDAELEYLGSLGFTGTIDDRIKEWLLSLGYNNIKEYLLGLGYSGTIQDMLLASLTDSAFYGAIFQALAPDSSGIMQGVLQGTGSLTTSHASTIYALDHEDVYRAFAANESIWKGGRVVKNLLTYSNDFSNVVWTATSGTKATNSFTATGANATLLQTVTGSYDNGIFSIYLTRLVGTGDIDITVDSGSTWTTVAVTGTQTRFSVAGTSLSGDTVGIRIVTSGDSVSLSSAQFEDSTGRTSTTIPSEYIATTSAAVKKVYAYANGNSVASNIVTEATGADFTEAPWLVCQPALTNSQIQSSDLTNVEWTATTATTARTSVGIAGVQNTATRVTATAGNATVIANAIVAASNTHTSKWWIKRITGTGTIELTLDNGATWQDVTSSIDSTYSEVIVQQTALTNPQIGIRIVTSGDAVDIGNAECYLTKSIANAKGIGPIFTTTVAASTDAVYASFNPANHDTSGVYYLEVQWASDDTVITSHTYISLDGAASNVLGQQSSFVISNDDTTPVSVASDWTAGTAIKIGVAYHLSDAQYSTTFNGATGTSAAFDGYNVTGNLLMGFGSYPVLLRNVRRYSAGSYASATALLENLTA